MDLLNPHEIYLSIAFYHSSPIARYVLPAFVVFEVYERGVERSLIHYSLHKDVYVVSHITLQHITAPKLGSENLAESLDAVVTVSYNGEHVYTEELHASDFETVYAQLNRLFSKCHHREEAFFGLKGRVRFFNCASAQFLLSKVTAAFKTSDRNSCYNRICTREQHSAKENKEDLFTENFRPDEETVRIYANSKQRTIATAEFFTAGLMPTGTQVRNG